MSTNVKKWIWVTFDKIGFHRYPGASEDPSLEAVKYLASVHRHKFNFKVQIEVFHADRELEFHMFQTYCMSLFDTTLNVDHKSVEMISDDLYAELAVEYPGRDMVISVDEDGECGCTIEYTTNCS